jgi:hypothetical protein
MEGESIKRIRRALTDSDSNAQFIMEYKEVGWYREVGVQLAISTMMPILMPRL